MSGYAQFGLWALPAVYLLAALTALGARGQAWRIATAAAVVVLIASLGLSPAGGGTLEGLTMVLMALLGWVICRYSRTYLAGEPGQLRYVVALLLTLAAVSTVVVSQHLGVLVAAWIASSLSLHHLLTFYRERPAAQIVAHKKFIASRLAELCMLAALILIYRETGTLTFAGIGAHVASLSALSPSLHAAAGLFALAVILKSAQLPVHGWLIQVMEAPTPVSALLHAGIVNIGGYVMIRLAELMSAAPVAQGLLIVVGSVTAAVAGLVMMTRISIKVRLAWSTCAQMGFMLMECGLGLYELAWLHLMAHSLYKAYLFLAAGDTVLEARRRQLVPVTTDTVPARRLVRSLLALPVSLLLVLGSVQIWRFVWPEFDMPLLALGIVGIGLAPLLWAREPWQWLPGTMAIVALSQLYLLWHALFATVVPAAPAPGPLLVTWAGLCFLTLYVMQAWLLAWPQGRVAGALYPWAYGGFYLDERFTRLTFRVWPARLNNRPRAGATVSTAILSGERA